MKKFFLILFSFPFFVKAQENSIMIEGAGVNMYVNHSAAPKENFYSIGRLYNISPKDIAPFNKLTLENGLSIGQIIKVPLRTVNFTQTNNVALDEVTVPVYHKVAANETLFQVSNKYNKVPAASLKKWNNLNSDDINQGQNIIVGYLKVKKDLSALAQQVAKMPNQQKETVQAPLKEKVAKKQAEIGKVKEDVKAKIEETVNAEKKIEIDEKAVVKTTPIEKFNKTNKEGFFKSSFNNTGKEEAGIAGIFKSTSGWEDGKYYCLHNSAEQNSIVKITNPANGKFVYAKVLDVMPDLKQNNELSVRISSAASEALGVDGNSNFNCKIAY